MTVADIRNCVQCGALFAPRREHARFCSPKCRVAWNCQRASNPAAGEDVLDWSIAAMRETTARLLRTKGWDRPQAYGLITEAVWWITMVDATLVRYHPETYGDALDDRDPAERTTIEETFAGLRFVRNRMGYEADHADFIQPGPAGTGKREGLIAAWTWKPVAEPALASLPPRGQEWEMSRYQAYQARLASHPIGDTFGQAREFLRLTADRRLSEAQ
jgi:hypothetical protein